MKKFVTYILTIALILPFTFPKPRTVFAAETSTENASNRNAAVKQMFSQYADSVVFVTGEFADPAKKELKEYFHIPKDSIRDGIGTGFFITSNGYIMTNAHGIHKSIDYIVELRNGKRYEAEVIGFIFEQDLALLKVDMEKPAKPVVFRQRSDIQTGDSVTSIGHPSGLKYTCSKGIITATNRRSDLTDIHITLDNLLQTDMPINPGASGGPWFDSNLMVVGMTESKGSESDNIAFGVTTATILKYLPQLYDFPRRNLFVRGFDVTSQKGRCVVKNVDENSPAAKAGLRNNDIILKVNGERISGLVGWLAQEENMNSRTPIKLTVGRLPSGEKQNIEFTFDTWNAPDANDILWEKIGLKVRPVTENEIKLLELKSPYAYVITNVDKPRFSHLEHKPQVGDVLGKIAFVRPHNLNHLTRLLDSLKTGNKVSIVILRVTDANTKQSVLLPNINSVTTTENNSGKNQSRNNSQPRRIKASTPKQITKTRIDISNFEVQ